MKKRIAIMGSSDDDNNSLKQALEKNCKQKISTDMYEYIISSNARDLIYSLTAKEITINGAILLVSAVDGPVVQTREHILLARQIGINRMLVFINRSDEMDEAAVLRVEEDTRSLLKEYYFNEEDILVIKGSDLKVLESHPTDLQNSCYLPITELLKNLQYFDKERVLI